MPAAREIASWLTMGRAAVRVPDQPGTVFLTFDDGPHPEHTPHLLETLQRFDARATFFMIGRVLREYPQVAAAVHRGGHRLANHSTQHPWFNRISWARQRQEIAETDALLQAVDGQQSHLFRPPHGRMSGACLLRTLFGPLRISLWTTDSLDYRLAASDVVEHLTAQGVRGGDILLFHDDAPVAAQALETLLPRWRSQGLQFAALPG